MKSFFARPSRRLRNIAGALGFFALWGSTYACGGSEAASCDALCANAFTQCNADADSCITACSKWRKQIPSGCSSQADALLSCVEKASDVMCGATTLTASSCDTQSSALATCEQHSGTSCSWTGTWNSTFGTLILTQNGNALTGTYPHDNGMISGTVGGNTAYCTWSQSVSGGPCAYGPLAWTMSADCSSFTGPSYYCDKSNYSATWTATRQ